MSEDPAVDKPIDSSSKKLTTQLLHSSLGEAAGFSVSIGAVYLAHYLMPSQTRAVTETLAERIAKWRGTHAGEERDLAKKVVDVTLMNVGGLSNMAMQFSLHRASMEPEDKPPLAHELGRLISGRAVGTVTALSMLVFARTQAPNAMASGESRLSKSLGNTPMSARFSELLMSNFVQSVGAVAGNVPAQLLYDKLVNNQSSKVSSPPSF